MQIQKYINDGAVFADDMSISFDESLTYLNVRELDGDQIVFNEDVAVSLNDVHDFVFDSDFSILFKAKVDKFDGRTCTSAIICGLGENDTFWQAAIRQHEGTYKIEFFLYENDSPLLTTLGVDVPDLSGKYNAIAIVGEGDSVSIYLNGKNILTTDRIISVTAAQDLDTMIGGSAAINQPNFVLTDVVIFDNAVDKAYVKKYSVKEKKLKWYQKLWEWICHIF